MLTPRWICRQIWSCCWIINVKLIEFKTRNFQKNKKIWKEGSTNPIPSKQHPACCILAIFHDQETQKIFFLFFCVTKTRLSLQFSLVTNHSLQEKKSKNKKKGNEKKQETLSSKGKRKTFCPIPNSLCHCLSLLPLPVCAVVIFYQSTPKLEVVVSRLMHKKVSQPTKKQTNN